MKKRFLFGLLALLICLAGCAAAGQETSTPHTSLGGDSSSPSVESSADREESTSTGEISLPAGFDSTEEPPLRLWEALTALFPDPELEAEIISFSLFIEVQAGDSTANRLAAAFAEHGYDETLWREITGNSLHVWESIYTNEPEISPFVRLLSMGKPGENKTTVMTFGGDISFADNYVTMRYLKTTENGLADCLAPEWFTQMQQADIAVLNNEFAISRRGLPMNGKVYTFRGDPENTALYHELGVDLVTLANNHVFDYGEEAFCDTLDSLRKYGIDYAGAGRTAEESQSPMYYLVDGRKIAFVSATRAEKNILTPEATETSPGVFRCYDPARLQEVLAEAKAESDYVVLLIHWGREKSHVLEDVQEETAPLYLEAGADLIIGAHAHRLQGIEFIDGKAVFYNLGNFWFDDYSIETGLVRFELSADGKESFYFLPGMQAGCVTSYELGTSVGRTILDHLESYSKNVTIRDDGLIIGD